MKKRDVGMAGSDYIGTKIALNFVLKGLTFPNYIINEELRCSMNTNRQDRKGKSIPMVAVHSEDINDIDDDKEIRERYLKHIAEITKDLAPPKFANLTEDQQDFLDRKGRYTPYRPTRSEVEEDDEEYW